MDGEARDEEAEWRQAEAVQALAGQLNSGALQVVFSYELRPLLALHRLPVAALGRVRALAEPPRVRNLLLMEMVARVVKGQLRQGAGRLDGGATLEQEYVAMMVDRMNLVFGSGPDSDALWTGSLKDAVAQKFDSALSDQERAAGYDLRRHLLLFSLFRSVQRACQVTFRKGIEEYFAENQPLGAQRLSINDVDKFTVLLPSGQDFNKVTPTVMPQNGVTVSVVEGLESAPVSDLIRDNYVGEDDDVDVDGAASAQPRLQRAPQPPEDDDWVVVS